MSCSAYDMWGGVSLGRRFGGQRPGRFTIKDAAETLTRRFRIAPDRVEHRREKFAASNGFVTITEASVARGFVPTGVLVISGGSQTDAAP